MKQARGITYAKVMRKRKEGSDHAVDVTDLQLMTGVSGERTVKYSLDPADSTKRRKIESHPTEGGKDETPASAEPSQKKSDLDLPVPGFLTSIHCFPGIISLMNCDVLVVGGIWWVKLTEMFHSCGADQHEERRASEHSLPALQEAAVANACIFNR